MCETCRNCFRRPDSPRRRFSFDTARACNKIAAWKVAISSASAWTFFRRRWTTSTRAFPFSTRSCSLSRGTGNCSRCSSSPSTSPGAAHRFRPFSRSMPRAASTAPAMSPNLSRGGWSAQAEELQAQEGGVVGKRLRSGEYIPHKSTIPQKFDNDLKSWRQEVHDSRCCRKSRVSENGPQHARTACSA